MNSVAVGFLLLVFLISAPVNPAEMKNRDELKRYFQRFGYLSSGNDSHELIESAIKRYQKTLGLSASGTLDRATVSEINAPRCGVPDVVTAPSRATERYVYFAGKPMWRRNIPMTLTYGFSRENTIASVGREQMRGAFRRAFARWAAVIPVNFEESDDYEFADIKIGFYSGDHGDGESFDGVLGVLAHAFSPESGRFHLDAAEAWAVDVATAAEENAVDLESVATHEIGHVLGLGHSGAKESIMYPSLRPRQRKVELKPDDIAGVQALYGPNPNFAFYRPDDVVASSGSDSRSDQLFFLLILTQLIFYYY